MLAERIKKFISDLESKRGLPVDEEIHKLLVSYFATKNSKSTLNEVDYHFLEVQFAKRWAAVKLTSNDYTRNPEGANQVWISLAKELAPCVSKSYIKILFPDVLNMEDPISLSPLNDTTNTDNLYLGHFGRVLYRKFGLCQYLIEKDFVLSTRRKLDSNEPRTLTVEELARLKSSTSREVEILKIKYVNFWEFLNAQVFTKLNDSNELPVSLISHFLPLIGRYFELKESAAPFSQFKAELSNFLAHLYKHDKEEINQLYGIHFEISGQKYYLLDFLIELTEAKDYSLDTTLKSLMNALYSLNPALLIKNPSINSFYPTIKADSAPSSLSQCRLMLLSLFTSNFDCYFWDKASISVCDKENQVSSQAAQIYNRFAPAISSNSEEEMVRIYNEVIAENRTAQAKTSYLSKLWTCIAPSPFITWFEHIKAGSLSSWGLEWYDPKLIIHALVRFRANKPEVGRLVETFLDELLRTYCQNPPISKFEKHMRINIIFNQFLSNLESTKERDALVQLLELCSDQDYRNCFMNNCIYYIGQRLQKINGNRVGDAGATFFAGSRQVEQLKTKIATESFCSVNDVIDKYRREIDENVDLRIDSKKRLQTYLYERQSPILTCDEELEAERSAPMEYLIRRG